MANSKADVLQSIRDGSILQTARHRTREDKILETLNAQIDQFFSKPIPAKTTKAQTATTPDESDRGYGDGRYYYGD